MKILQPVKSAMGRLFGCASNTVSSGHHKKQNKKKKRKQKQKNSEEHKNVDTPTTTKIDGTNTVTEEELSAKSSPPDGRNKRQVSMSDMSDSGFEDEFLLVPVPRRHLMHWTTPPTRHQSVPILYQTDPPLSGITREWKSDPERIDISGITGGHVNKSNVAGVVDGNLGGVVVNVTQPDAPASTRNSGGRDVVDNDIRETRLNETQTTKQAGYIEDIDQIMEKWSNFLLLNLVLPGFIVSLIANFGINSPLVLFGILIAAFNIVKFSKLTKMQ